MSSFSDSWRKKITAVILILLFTFSLISCEKLKSGYDASYLEKKLSMPYMIEGSLTQNGEKYEVIINSDRENFTIEFKSGDVTEGLTVEFFENGVFLMFDDYRFKTNSEMFTNLESLKNGFDILSKPFVEKLITNTEPVNGIDLIEIEAQTETAFATAYINKKDGELIRIYTTADASEIIFDIKKFENITETTEISTADDEA